MAWSPRADGTFAVEVDATRAWPWAFEVTLAPTLNNATLTLDYRLRNRSDEHMPGGIGLHPWFRGPLGVRVPAGRVYASNTASDAVPLPVDGRFDLRTTRPLAAGLDATWTSLGGAGVVASLGWPELGIGMEIEARAADAPVLVALASPADLGAAAIEPQTHGPDPFRRLAMGEPDAPRLLAPGEVLPLIVRFTARVLPDADPDRSA